MQQAIIDYHCDAILRFAKALNAKNVLHYKPMPQMAMALPDAAEKKYPDIKIHTFANFDDIPAGSVGFDIAVSMHYLDRIPLKMAHAVVKDLYKHGHKGFYVSITPKGGETSSTVYDGLLAHPDTEWHGWDTSYWFRMIVENGPKSHSSEILTLAKDDDVQYLVKHNRVFGLYASGNTNTTDLHRQAAHVA